MRLRRACTRASPTQLHALGLGRPRGLQVTRVLELLGALLRHALAAEALALERRVGVGAERAAETEGERERQVGQSLQAL